MFWYELLEGWGGVRGVYLMVIRMETRKEGSRGIPFGDLEELLS